MTTVSNSGAPGFPSQYLSNIQYRAWGAMKNMLGNIVRFSRNFYKGDEYAMAKHYYNGPGDQDAYAKEVLGRYEAYKPFFKCLGAK